MRQASHDFADGINLLRKQDDTRMVSACGEPSGVQGCEIANVVTDHDETTFRAIAKLLLVVNTHKTSVVCCRHFDPMLAEGSH